MENRNGGGELTAGAGVFGVEDKQKWVYDSSVDYKGRVPLRASTGAWKASLFIISIEFSERLTYFGIAANLISYLVKVLHQDLDVAAKNANYWSGVTLVAPLLGGFLADAYAGRYLMVLISSIIYILGLGLLTMCQYAPALKPGKNAHEVVFFMAIYLIGLGTGGYKPCLQSFGADQYDDDDAEERRQRMSFFNWWNFSLCCGLFLGVTVIVYVEDNVGWGASSATLTTTMALAVVTFYAGRRWYRYRSGKGSPLTPMLQVLVAAMAKRNVARPSDPALLHEDPKNLKSQGRLLCHTSKLRFLDRAAIVEEESNFSAGQKRASQWRLATVTQVEELKLLVNLTPIWLCSLMFGVSMAQSSTFFVKQGSTMDRKIGSFEIPPASIHALGAIAMLITVVVYDKLLVPRARRITGLDRGIKILQRVGFGLTFSILAMATAAMVERKRLRSGNPMTMSVFWLAPQHMILGCGDAFTLVGLQEYFYDQVPDSMRSLGIAFYLSVIGVGSFLSSLLITVVDRFADGEGWIGKSVDESRLDKFYWLLAALDVANMCIFVVVARRYTYKSVQGGGGGGIAVADCNDEEDKPSSMA